MFGKRVFLARNEKKSGYSGLKSIRYAQSTLEFALVFPMLILLVLGIIELAFMWHQYNSVELAAREISSNLALIETNACSDSAEVSDIIAKKTAFLQERQISFSVNAAENVATYTSNESFKGNPFVVVKIDCNGRFSSFLPEQTVQVEAAHRLHFFAASLPDFRTGKRIVIIPSSVVLVSSKIGEVARN